MKPDVRSTLKGGRLHAGAASTEKARERAASVNRLRTWITLGEAAELARVSTFAINRAAQTGELVEHDDPERTGVVFDADDLRAWAKRKKLIFA